MPYASYDPRPLSEIAIVDQKSIKEIASNLSEIPETELSYRVQHDLVLEIIEYPLYVLDGTEATTILTLPPAAAVAMGTIITLLNPTKDNFEINGNDVNIVRVGVESRSITLTEYQCIKLILIDIGPHHDSLWYELISIPAGGGSGDMTKAIYDPNTDGIFEPAQLNISGKVDKEIGKGLSANNYTTIEKDKLSGIAENANNYSHPANHSPSIITQNENNRFVTDTEKGTWNAKEPSNANIQAHVTAVHAPSNAQKNSDIIQSEIEAKLVGTISSHSHAGGSDPFIAKLILATDKATGANVTPITLGISFDYEANNKYVIDIYAIVAPAAATTGCGFLIDVSSVVTYVGTFASHQLAIGGTISGGGSIGDLGATSQGVSSGMVGTGSNFVYGGGILITGANAGTATFYFRSETTAITTCKAGSMFRIMKMN